MKQNIAAVVILLATAVSLWAFWPRTPSLKASSSAGGGSAAAAAAAVGSRLEGNLERADRNRIAGWAWDANRPDEPVKVEISDGVNPPVTVVADKFREGLQAAGKGNGRHAFVYDPGPRLSAGKTYVIQVKVAGASTELKGSPRQVVVSGASPESRTSTRPSR
jgi:hypothetical protein